MSDEKDEIVCAGKKEAEKIFEQIEIGVKSLYAIRWFKQNEVEISESIGDYVVMDRNKVVWPKFGKPVKCDPLELFVDIRFFLKEHVFLPDEDLYDVVTAFIIATYFQEEFEYATYLTFLGPIKSGKSKMLRLLEMLCYRGFKTSSVTPAATSRLIEYYKVTLLFDETDKVASEYRTDTIAILNEGQKRPSRYVRAERDGPGIEIKDVWGFKAFAGTEKFMRSITSRSINFPMRKPNQRMPKLNHESEEIASGLRNRLLWLRLMWKPKESFNDDFLSDDRISEVFESLFRVSPSDDITETLKRCALKVEFSEEEEEKTSIEAQVFKAILDTVNRGKMVGSKIAIMDISDTMNIDLDEKEKYRNSSIGRIVNRLGFQKTRMTGGKSGISWNKKLVNDLAGRYLDKNGMDAYISKEPSLHSLPSINIDDESEDSEDKIDNEKESTENS